MKANVSYTPADDEALLRLAERAKQDGDALAELYRRTVQRVYRYCLARVGNAADAEELTAETFLAITQAIGQFRGRSQFMTWLLGIAHHKVADHFRRGRSEVALDDVADIADPETHLDELIVDRLQLAQVQQALTGLATDRAEVISLHLFAGLPIPAVAQVMQRSEAAVRMLLSRAMHDLRVRLARHVEVPDKG